MLDLPSPPRYRMSAAPLAQALVQVNFPIVTRLQTLDGAAAVQAALGRRYPYLAQNVIQQMSLMVGPAGPAAPPQTSQNVVHELTSDDGWTLTLTVSSATLSVGEDYAGVDDFAGRFAEVCAALTATNVHRQVRPARRALPRRRGDRGRGRLAGLVPAADRRSRHASAQPRQPALVPH